MSVLPKDFSDALKANGLDDFFSDYTAAHRREYLKWIQEAKRPETRKQRIGQAVKMISRKAAEERLRSRQKN